MGTNRFVVALAAVVAVAAAGACERTTPVAPPPGARTPAVRAALTPLTDGQAMGKFQVCSAGSAATYTFSAQNDPDLATGQLTGSVTVAAGDCAVIYSTDVPGLATVNAVTITMTNPTTPNMVLTSIVGHRLFWHCDTNGCTTDDTPTTFTNTTSVTYNVNGDLGALAYFNFTAQPPSLTLVKTADAASVAAGTPIGFTLTVNSGGPGTAQNVTLSDPLPGGAGINWSISPANAACGIAGGTLSCSFGDLAPGTSASVHITSPTTTQSCGTYDNTASAQANGLLPVQATATTAVQCPAPCPPSAIASNFNGTPIAAGNWIWFNAIVKVTGIGATGGVVHALGSSIAFTANGTSYNLPVPDATITFSPTATQATTSFNSGTGAWETTVPTSYSGNVFLGGLAFQLPVAFPGGINPVTWTTQLSSSVAGVTYQWKWAAAVYTSFAANSNAIGAKPIDGGTLNPYANSDHAGTPESFKAFVIGGARGGGGSNWTGSYSGTASSGVCTR